MSARTANYVQALIQEGENFDYDAWLRRVRQQEAQANQRSEVSILGKAVSAQFENRQGASPARRSGRYVTAASMVTNAPGSRVVDGSPRGRRGTTSNDRLKRWLQKVQVAWHDFQGNRARDAVYDYLQAVFALVMHFKLRRKTKKLLRRAFKFAEQRFDKNADLFIAIIRATSGNGLDNKMISKWARALRYAARRKPPEMRLKAFMKAAGGVNACAAGYASRRRRARP